MASTKQRRRESRAIPRCRMVSSNVISKKRGNELETKLEHYPAIVSERIVQMIGNRALTLELEAKLGTDENLDPCHGKWIQSSPSLSLDQRCWMLKMSSASDNSLHTVGCTWPLFLLSMAERTGCCRDLIPECSIGERRFPSLTIPRKHSLSYQEFISSRDDRHLKNCTQYFPVMERNRDAVVDQLLDLMVSPMRPVLWA